MIVCAEKAEPERCRTETASDLRDEIRTNQECFVFSVLQRKYL